MGAIGDGSAAGPDRAAGVLLLAPGFHDVGIDPIAFGPFGADDDRLVVAAGIGTAIGRGGRAGRFGDR